MGVAQLIDAARKVYASGKMKPKRGTYNHDGCGCVLGAAAYSVDPEGESVSTAETCEKSFGISSVEVSGIIRGFDGKEKIKFICEENVDKQKEYYDEAYELAKAFGNEVLPT